MDQINGMNSKVAMNDEQEIIALLASLVRSHYLEKSSQYHMALDFEKLFKLDSLQQLRRLDELDHLKSLDQLKSLENLKELKEMRELSHLHELKSLDHLERLSALKELGSLENLSSLKQLERLNQLSNLQELSRLEELNNLNQLKDLSSLKELQELKQLDKLSDLKELRRLEVMDQLQNLTKLEELKELNNLSRLKELDKLEIIQKLGDILHDHRSTLRPLEHLDELKNLENLKELRSMDNLTELNRLEKLKSLDKLDRIEDAKFAERLDKLDKLEILKSESRKLVIQQIIGTALEFGKIVTAGAIVFFLLSLESGRQITAKALPALGFGQSAQVNLALKLLVNETSPDFFQSTIGDLKKRIHSEMDNIFSANSFLSLDRRLELLQEILNYSFQSKDFNLQNDNKKVLLDRLKEMTTQSFERIEYEMAQARTRSDIAFEDNLRVVKLLLMEKRYPQVLEKALPYWGKTDSMTSASLLSAINLQMSDPKTLKAALRSAKAMQGNRL